MSNQILLKYPKNWGLNRLEVIKIARKALIKRNLTNVELSILFVGSRRAKKLNILYRKKDYIPQVLGFPMSRQADEDGKIRLGDIVICTQKLKYEAIYSNKSISMILNEWLLHGVDNLLKN